MTETTIEAATQDPIAHAATPEATTQPSPARQRRRSPRTQQALAQAIQEATDAARTIQASHPTLARGDWMQVIRAFRSALIPRRRPGRKRRPEVTAAAAAFVAGTRGVALFRQFIRGWGTMSEWRRREAARRL